MIYSLLVTQLVAVDERRRQWLRTNGGQQYGLWNMESDQIHNHISVILAKVLAINLYSISPSIMLHTWLHADADIIIQSQARQRVLGGGLNNNEAHNQLSQMHVIPIHYIFHSSVVVRFNNNSHRF